MKCYVRFLVLEVVYLKGPPRRPHKSLADGKGLTRPPGNFGDIGDDWTLEVDGFSLGKWTKDLRNNAFSHGTRLRPLWSSKLVRKGECEQAKSLAFSCKAEELEGSSSQDRPDTHTESVTVTLKCGATKSGWVHVEVIEDKQAAPQHRVATIAFRIEVESLCLDPATVEAARNAKNPGGPNSSETEE